MTDSVPITVLVVDDHPVVRSGIAAILSGQEDMRVIGQATDGSEATVMLRSLNPHVALIDLTLPDVDGIELIAELKKVNSKVRFVVLSARMTAVDINRALQAGAHAYLFKDSPSQELINAIRIVSAGGRYLPPTVGNKADQLSNALQLTNRERQIILLVARGFGTQKISNELAISQDTVKTHVRNVLAKCELESRSEVVALCLRTGVIRIEDL